MKILFYIIIIKVLFTIDFSCAQFIEGREYLKIYHPIVCKTDILEFFSFYCNQCYKLEKMLNFSKHIKLLTLNKIKINKYHVSYLGLMGKDLTKAWIIATKLRLENIVSTFIFRGIQKTNTINKPDDIKSIFVKFGVNEKQYDLIYNSFSLKKMLDEQNLLIKKINLNNVPSILIKGKYIILCNKIYAKSYISYLRKLDNLVVFLMNKQ